MRFIQLGGLVRRAMLVVAGISVIIALFDVLNVVPNVASKITPVLLAAIIFFLLYMSYHQQLSFQLMRSIKQRMGKQTASPMRKPNKKRQQNPQPEYRTIAWHGLTLRSHSEVKIAKALDTKDVLFLADPKIRLHTENHRQTREVDFLVQYQGKWGILEVDGPQHERSIEADTWRDARFTEQGLLVMRFPADQCYRQPEIVVEQFLQMLAVHSPDDSSSS